MKIKFKKFAAYALAALMIFSSFSFAPATVSGEESDCDLQLCAHTHDELPVEEISYAPPVTFSQESDERPVMDYLPSLFFHTCGCGNPDCSPRNAWLPWQMGFTPPNNVTMNWWNDGPPSACMARITESVNGGMGVNVLLQDVRFQASAGFDGWINGIVQVFNVPGGTVTGVNVQDGRFPVIRGLGDGLVQLNNNQNINQTIEVQNLYLYGSSGGQPPTLVGDFTGINIRAQAANPHLSLGSATEPFIVRNSPDNVTSIYTATHLFVNVVDGTHMENVRVASNENINF